MMIHLIYMLQEMCDYFILILFRINVYLSSN